MLKGISKKFRLDVYITFIATFISVLFIVTSYILEDYAIKILSILVIVLPTIYIIGNLIIRGIMDRELKELKQNYEEGLFDVDEGIEDMRLEIERLEKENKKIRNFKQHN